MNKMLANRLGEEMEEKIISIVDEVYNDVKMELPAEYNFADTMVGMVRDRLSNDELNRNSNYSSNDVDNYIRSIL